MEKLTKAQRTMVYLYKYRYTDTEYGSDAPFGLTQDRIGETLWISKSYASLIT